MNIKSKSIFACVGILLILSCEGKGPKATFDVPDRTTDEIFEETTKAIENDTYIYMGTVELHYYDGDWYSAGMYKQYHYPNGDKDYVLFGSSDYMPVYTDTDRGDYCHRVRYMGVDYYY